MGMDPIKVGVLTSSRADFGIYLPLITEIKSDPDFQLTIIAFGTHLSELHGKTIKEIKQVSSDHIDTIPSILASDDEESVSTAYALTALKFSSYWRNSSYDLVFCIGDRYEMAAAVSAGIPYNIKFAHIHGGETTLGAIDNIYRHSISLASILHFASANAYRKRLEKLLGYSQNIFVTGSLSLVNMKNIDLLSVTNFFERWKIDLNKKYILMTLHPETVDSMKNYAFSVEIKDVLQNLALEYQIVITMPNADTHGSVYRAIFENVKKQFPDHVHLVENFGTQSYFTCMAHSDLMIGNSSSGIIESASFGKYAINIGDRQKGRLTNKNVIHCPFEKKSIIEAVNNWAGKKYKGENLFQKENTVNEIITAIKKYHNE